MLFYSFFCYFSTKLSAKLKDVGVAGVFITCGGATSSEIPHSNELVAVHSTEMLKSSVDIPVFVSCTLQDSSDIISFFGLFF